MVVAYRLKWFSVHAGEFKTEEGIIGGVPAGSADRAVESVVSSVVRRWGLSRRPSVSYQAADGLVEALIAVSRLP